MSSIQNIEILARERSKSLKVFLRFKDGVYLDLVNIPVNIVGSYDSWTSTFME
jgi:hypothetical protein